MKGVAGGIIVPSTMSMLYRYVPKHLQAGYLGNVMLLQSVGLAMGPALAGVLLQVSSWHVLFLFNVPLVALVLWAGARSIPAEAGCHAEKGGFLGRSANLYGHRVGDDCLFQWRKLGLEVVGLLGLCSGRLGAGRSFYCTAVSHQPSAAEFCGAEI